MDDENKAQVEAAIAAYQSVRNWEGGPEIILAQALADLRDYADLHGLNFAEADREAYQMYLENK